MRAARLFEQMSVKAANVCYSRWRLRWHVITEENNTVHANPIIYMCVMCARVPLCVPVRTHRSAPPAGPRAARVTVPPTPPAGYN